MPTPPAAVSRWNSTRSSETSAFGVLPSKVADLIRRLRRVIGPSFAGAKTSATVSAMTHYLPNKRLHDSVTPPRSGELPPAGGRGGCPPHRMELRHILCATHYLCHASKIGKVAATCRTRPASG